LESGGGEMRFKSKFIEFIIKHDLIPTRVKWKRCAGGVGRLFRDVFHMLDEDGKRTLMKLMYRWGVEDADEIVETLKIDRNLHGCAIALLAVNQLFGIKSKISKESDDEIIIHATKCLWKDKEGWTPKVCASIEAYDIGLVEGINKNVKYFCTRRRSTGDKFCEVSLKKS
jgi:hypothetical protein